MTVLAKYGYRNLSSKYDAVDDGEIVTIPADDAFPDDAADLLVPAWCVVADVVLVGVVTAANVATVADICDEDGPITPIGITSCFFCSGCCDDGADVVENALTYSCPTWKKLRPVSRMDMVK